MTTKREMLLSRLEESVLVADGAMGTLLNQKGLHETKSREELNLTDPGLIEEIHSDYLSAGSQIITTNTFKANRLHLRDYNLENKVQEINRAGMAIAKRANRMGHALIGASIGAMRAMLKPYGDLEISDVEAFYREQIISLAEGEPDLFILETQQSLLEVEMALRIIKEVAPDIPILASFTFSKEGRTYFGDEMLGALQRVASCGADIAGINCSLGPNDMAELVERAARRFPFPLSIMPNAGYPALVKGKVHYLSSPEYMADFAKQFLDLGINIIGGCCGTTPAHIRKIAEYIKGKKPASRILSLNGDISIVPSAEGYSASHIEKGFFRKLGKDFVITVEIDPPKGSDCGPALVAARLLKKAGVDAVDIAENPLARVRLAPMVVAHIIHSETGLSTILHMTCRDRNLLGIQSDLLGASALGVDAVLALRGDPANIGDFPDATSVNDVTTIGLVRIIASLNRGLDFADNPIVPETNFNIGVGASPNSASIEDERKRIQEKVSAGAEFAMTQPIYDVDGYKRFIDAVSGLKIYILPGILPLRTIKHALYLRNEVPGITVPDDIIEKMNTYASKEDQAKFGIEVARNILDNLKRFCPGAYLMPPFSNYKAIVDILS